MKTRRYEGQTLIGLLLTVLLAGCGSGGDTPGATMSPPGGGSGSVPALQLNRGAISRTGALEFSAATDSAVYSRGQPVTVALEVSNTGAADIDYLHAAFNDVTVSQGATVIWQFTRVDPAGFGPPDTLGRLRAGQTMSFPPLIWNQQDQQGNYVAPGQYSIKAWWTPAYIGPETITASQAEAQYAAPPLTVTVLDGPTPPKPPTPTPPAPPGAPGALSATTDSRGVLLQWQAGDRDFLYNIYRRTPDGTYSSPLIRTMDVTVQDISVFAGGAYVYLVKGVSIDGIEGPASNEISITASPDVGLLMPPAPPSR